MILSFLVGFNFCAIGLFTAQQTDLAFGHRQIEQFICDRPTAGAIIKCQPRLRQTLEFQFAGGASGSRVYWDDREPIGPRPAEHMRSGEAYPAMVRVSRTRSPGDQCAMLLIELYNFEVDKEFDLLTKSNQNMRKSPTDFAKSCVHHEFEASRKSQQFFRRNPLDVTACGDSPYYQAFMASDKEDFTKYMRWLSDREQTFSPLKYYREAYFVLLKIDRHGDSSDSVEKAK